MDVDEVIFGAIHEQMEELGIALFEATERADPELPCLSFATETTPRHTIDGQVYQHDVAVEFILYTETSEDRAVLSGKVQEIVEDVGIHITKTQKVPVDINTQQYAIQICATCTIA